MFGQILACGEASVSDEYALQVLTSGVSYELEVTYEEFSERILDGLLFLKS